MSYAGPQEGPPTILFDPLAALWRERNDRRRRSSAFHPRSGPGGTGLIVPGPGPAPDPQWERWIERFRLDLSPLIYPVELYLHAEPPTPRPGMDARWHEALGFWVAVRLGPTRSMGSG
ncbi:hypothetical protein [Paludisphaera mucosa]|uniref:Uncharacterized protein n=1 Tax=Paludisphaera mucosa TaxID=3030827 RepID=A0ABT6F6S6_9BACT|nr:hypothetical protein [Paludisphaera mucosa]MDG3003227.1 hypothetical protein [Paludisphaera mucosa]